MSGSTMSTRRLLGALLAGVLLLAGCAGDPGVEDAGTTADETAEAPADAPDDEAAATASASFVSPEDGAEVSSPVQVEMQAEGITIEPADAGVNPGAGHFHIMVDAGCIEAGEVIPNDDEHLHFGDGSTEAEVELEPGEHTLCLQVADGEHEALDVTDEITITVTE